MNRPRVRNLGEHLGMLGAELAILAIVYVFVVREPSIVFGLGAVIIATNLSPQRYEGIVGGIGLAGVGFWVHKATGLTQIPAVFALIGLVIFVYALVRLLASGPTKSGR